MNIQFKNTHGGLYAALQERIERKLLKLARLTDTPEHSANALFELERTVGSHQNGNIWQADITVNANGTRFHSSELADSPEKASQKVLREIRTELKKARGRRAALVRRGGSVWKAFHQRLTQTT